MRGLVRFIVLLAPPLAVFVLMNNYRQGLPDMAARTLVLTTDQSQPASRDDDEQSDHG